MNTAILLTGSNIKSRRKYLALATDAIAKEIGQVFDSSAIYETESWGFDAEMAFLNQALCVRTPLCASDVLDKIQIIEKEMGRKRNADGSYSSRTIDVDILFFNDEVIHNPNLQIPHPHLHKRMFALMPLNDVVSSYVHPVLKKNVDELLKECSDPLAVELFQNA
jgi:2-amino-4-hydroxy-6-hydroxymethyldihydropteridine diphosphokinase